MPSLDDDQQFEAELRRFALCEVAPLPSVAASRSRWWMAAAAVVLAAIGMMVWHIHGVSSPVVVSNPEVNSGEVTLGRAQAALAQSPSFEEAIDRLEKASRPTNQSKAHVNQSALAALGKEEL